MWKHDPYWNGKGDAVGLCTSDSGTLGPQSLPCLGEDQYSWGIHCDGSVVHKGDVVSLISDRKHTLPLSSIPPSSSKEEKEEEKVEDVKAVWRKNCVVTCILDCEKHTFSIEVNGEAVKNATIKDLPSGVKFFPVISTCPSPEEDEDDEDHDKDDVDMELHEELHKNKQKVKSSPLISIVREVLAAKKDDETTTTEVKEEEEVVVEEETKKPVIPPKEIFGWQWKRTDKTIWNFFDEDVELNIEKEYKSKSTGWHYVYNWDHKGWSELPEGEQGWRLSINVANPMQCNVYKNGHGFYYLMRRLSSGYEPSREGDARWMYESEKGWQVYDQAHSDEIEEAWQTKRNNVTIISESRTVHVDLKHLQQFGDGADNSKAERVRRQQLSEGMLEIESISLSLSLSLFCGLSRALSLSLSLTHTHTLIFAHLYSYTHLHTQASTECGKFLPLRIRLRSGFAVQT